MNPLTSLRNYKSDAKQGTSLLSIICPPSMDIKDLRDLIKHEISTAVNIKGNSNRKSVVSSLNKVKSFVSSLKKIPDTGIAIFSGEYI